MECDFCSIKERAIIRTEHALAFLSNRPLLEGHILICPKRHIQKIDEISEDETRDILSIIKNLKPALCKSFRATGFNFGWNENASAGQTISHLHIHMFPRTDQDIKKIGHDPRQDIYRPSAQRPLANTSSLEKTAELIRKHL